MAFSLASRRVLNPVKTLRISTRAFSSHPVLRSSDDKPAFAFLLVYPRKNKRSSKNFKRNLPVPSAPHGRPPKLTSHPTPNRPTKTPSLRRQETARNFTQICEAVFSLNLRANGILRQARSVDQRTSLCVGVLRVIGAMEVASPISEWRMRCILSTRCWRRTR